MFSPWIDSVTEKYTFPDGRSISRRGSAKSYANADCLDCEWNLYHHRVIPVLKGLTGVPPHGLPLSGQEDIGDRPKAFLTDR